jgi:hypothetical protein
LEKPNQFYSNQRFIFSEPLLVLFINFRNGTAGLQQLAGNLYSCKANDAEVEHGVQQTCRKGSKGGRLDTPRRSEAGSFLMTLPSVESQPLQRQSSTTGVLDMATSPSIEEAESAWNFSFLSIDATSAWKF